MTSHAIVKLTDADFDAQIKNHPCVLVDFWAEWCGPCRMVAPILDELASEYGNRLTVGKVNVDENREVAARFGVRSIPTLLLLRDGVRVDQIVGAHPKATIKAKVDQFLSAK
ncbi:MAG: thioredoxin [Zetaproteobacteria bacterium]|nr:MAG: thioredoxin [Zetaproteobacteria bacterium]